jgi:hypothetical protein
VRTAAKLNVTIPEFLLVGELSEAVAVVKDLKVIKVFRVHKVIKVFKDHTVTKVFKVHKLGDQGQGTGIHQGPTGCIGFNDKGSCRRRRQVFADECTVCL